MRLSFVALGLRATALVLLLSSVAASQALTGRLFGTVRDQTGVVLPGASVSVSSPALIGGRGTTMTDENGRFRFPSLMPGEYVLEIERTGFQTYREEAMPIRVGGSLERMIDLQIAGISTEVIVEGRGSAVEGRRSGLSNRYGEDQIKAIPVRRYSMFDFIKAAPGVSPTSPSSGTDNSVSVYGSGGNENLYLLDGTNFTCPCSGGAAPQPDVDVIQEIQIDSVGASAEYGNIQGAVINIVTKQGGNRVIFDASYYGQWDELTSHPVELPCVRCSLPRSQYTRRTYRDSTSHIGGPILRDRIWFFGGYQYLRDYDSQPGTDPLFPRTSQYDKVFAKATWQITPAMRLMSSVHDEWWTSPERPTLSRPFETTLRFSGSRPTTTFGELTHIISSNALWDLRVSRFVAPQTNEPSTGNRQISNRVDLATGLASGGPQQFGGLTLIRTAVKASFTRYRSGLFGADHEVKAGLQVENGEHFGDGAIPNGVRYTDNNGAPFQATFREPSTSGGEFITTGLFASDALRLGARLTVNLGLRFDYNRAISQDLPARDLDGRKTGEMIRGAGTLYTWNVLSPRLGFTLKLSEDSKTMLRASYGRFHQGVLTGELASIHPGITPTTTASFDPATGRYSRIISVVDPLVNVRLDPRTKSPRTDQFGIGLDRDLGHQLTMAIGYVRKHGDDFIGWTDTGGVYRPQTRTLPDGRAFDVFVLANATADRRFLLTNPPEFSLRYHGMVLALEKRWSHGWQALASYTLSETEGLQPSSGADAGNGQFSSIVGGSLVGRDPNSLTNARGKLANDRTHKLGLMGSVAVPKTGLMLAANLQYLTGTPWAATAQINLPQGLQRVLLEPPGSRRLSSQTLLDLRVSRKFALPGRTQVELLVDVLNALNDDSAERLADSNLFSQNFARPTAFIDPRRAMVGVRIVLPH